MAQKIHIVRLPTLACSQLLFAYLICSNGKMIVHFSSGDDFFQSSGAQSDWALILQVQIAWSQFAGCNLTLADFDILTFRKQHCLVSMDIPAGQTGMSVGEGWSPRMREAQNQFLIIGRGSADQWQ